MAAGTNLNRRYRYARVKLALSLPKGRSPSEFTELDSRASASGEQAFRGGDEHGLIFEPTMIRSEAERYLELLKRRVASLRLMAKELRECRESFTSMDLEATREHISYQQGLCSEIRALDDELRVVRRQLALGSGLEPLGMSAAAFDGLFDADCATQLRQVRDDLDVVQKNVQRLNRVYAGLLKRSRRSINVLINVMANYVGTYKPSPGRSGWSFPW